MNHKKVYDDLCFSRFKMNRRKGDGNYYERHHIVPKWLGGGDSPDNLVLLTAREHYIAHYLLFKHYQDKKSAAAFHKMNNTINNNHRDSKKYEELRRFQSEAFAGDKNPAKRADVRAKISLKVSGENNGMFGKTGESNPFYGKTHDEMFLQYKKELHGNKTTFNGVTYPSLRDAERQTGVSRFLIKKQIAK